MEINSKNTINLIRLRLKYLISTKNLRNIGGNFLLSFGCTWLLIECPSALSSKFKNTIDNLDPWLLIIALFSSVFYALYKAYPRITYTRKFKSTQTSISIKVGDLLGEKGNLVIGSSNYFDFDYNKSTGVSLKSQVINKLFKNDVNSINNLIKKSLKGLEHLAEFDEIKKYGNKLKYPIGTVAILPQDERKIFVVILTELILKGKDKDTKSDPEILNKALIGLWQKIKLEGRKKEFSLPVLGAGLSHVQLSYLLIIQTILLSYAIYSRNTAISNKMNLVISPDDYNPEDFEEAKQFLNSLQI